MLLVYVRPITMFVLFCVVNDSSSFNIILRHTWIHKTEAILFSYHQKISFLIECNQIDLRGDKKFLEILALWLKLFLGTMRSSPPNSINNNYSMGLGMTLRHTQLSHYKAIVYSTRVQPCRYYFAHFFTSLKQICFYHSFVIIQMFLLGNTRI